jgi:hypothetical protein
MLVTRAISSFALVVCVTAVLLAQAPALDIKYGLWENTVVTDMGGAMAQMDTSKMSPEQAAKFAEVMKGMSNRAVVEKTCLTKEELSKDSFMMPQDTKTSCTRTITTNTRLAFAANIDCTGERTMKGQINVESLEGGNAYKGTMKMTSAGRTGRSMNMTMTMTGKYLGPACGNVK